MMNSLIANIGSVLMSTTSSFSRAFNFIAATTGNSVAKSIWGFLVEIVYFICKWVLYVVDILFFYIQELCGLNIDTSSFKAMLRSDTDILFRFFLESKDTMTKVIRNLIAIGIVLIIVFSIIAIVKQQFKMMSDGKPQNVGDSIKTGVKAIFLMFLTPMFIIFSILASNVLLKTLYQITNVSGASSVGSQIFATASVSANKYREYAVTGERVPIVLDFSKQEEYLDMLNSNSLNQEFIDFMNSEESPIYRACTEFGQGKFIAFDKLNNMRYRGNDKVANQVVDYYKAYDCLNHSDSGNAQYEKIRAYQEEYMVMADVVDYAVKSSNAFYFMTVEQVYNSLLNFGYNDSDIKMIFNNSVSIKNAEDGLYEFSSVYYSFDEDAEISRRTTIEYNHVAGATDEINGAVFIVAVEESKIVDGEIKTCYTPLKNGYKGISDYAFESEYLLDGSVIAAKGIFDENGYPTAIKISKDGTQVQFYRDNLVMIAIGDSGDLMTNTYQEADEGGGFFSGIFKFIARLFSPANLVPNLQISTDAMAQSYTKETTAVNRLEGGKFQTSYIFNDSITGKLSGNLYGLKLYNVYEPADLNALILVMGTLILFKVFFNSILALIKRIYDLFLLTLMYPAACASIPMYSNDKNSYSLWFKTYVGKVYATYGLILGVNFVLLLFPIINSIEFFTMEEVATSKVIHRVGGVFFLFMSIGAITRMLNFLTAIIFELAAFALLGGEKNVVAELITKMASPGQPSITDASENPIKDIKAMATNMAKTIGKVGAFFTGLSGVFKIALIKKERRNFLKKLAPGNAIATKMKDKAFLKKQKKKQKEAYNDLRESIDSITQVDPSKISKEEKKAVAEKLKAFQEAQKNYSSALADPTGARKTEEDKKKKEKKAEAESSRAEENANDQTDFDGMDDNQISNAQKETQKQIKRLEKLEKKGKITDEQSKQLEGSRSRLEKLNATAQDRTKTDKDLKDNQKKIKELEKKKVLTVQEQEELDNAYEKVNKLSEKKKSTAQAIKDAKKAQKKVNPNREKKRKEKQEAKETKKRRKELKKNRAFKTASHNPIAKIQRDRILKSKEKELKKMQTKLSRSLGQDVSKLSSDELNKLKDFSPEVRNQIQAYQSSLSRADELLEIRDKALNYKEEQKQQADLNFLSKRHFGFIRYSRRRFQQRGSKADKRNLKLQQTESDLANVNSINLRKRNKYKSKINVLGHQVERSDKWKQHDTPDGRRALRNQARETKKQKKLARKLAKKKK